MRTTNSLSDLQISHICRAKRISQTRLAQSPRKTHPFFLQSVSASDLLLWHRGKNLRCVEAACEEEARWSLKAFAEFASCRGCLQKRRPLVLEGLRWTCVVSMLLAKKKPSGPWSLALYQRSNGRRWSLKESTRHVGTAPLELQYCEPGPENAVCAVIVWLGASEAVRWREVPSPQV